MATLIRASGAQVDVTPRDPIHGFTRLECYALLDCTTIEAIRLPGGRLMIVDEDGKSKAQPIVNQWATDLTGCLHPAIVGHALVCQPGEFQ